ncbi:MAG: hypothetical protein QOE61_4934 [Micromonosporaceae bacterium]|jgi:hypothetical protein|nr:hypothetical protein [Micromonosporaceae bacterium]
MLRRVGWLRRIVPVVLGLVGLIFLIDGGWLLLSQHWAHATGTVGACTARIVPNGTNGGSRTEQTCEVTWQLNRQSHASSIDVGLDVVSGRHVELRVNGDNAVLATPVWVGAATAAGGLALVVVAGAVFARQR